MKEYMRMYLIGISLVHVPMQASSSIEQLSADGSRSPPSALPFAHRTRSLRLLLCRKSAKKPRRTVSPS